MKKIANHTLPTDLEEEARALAALGDTGIDLSDIAEVADWSAAERGKFHRPIKQQLTLRLDADLIHWFKSHAPAGGYQTRINQALRRFVEAQQRKAG
jgi:uncharacterized protein (DUF4415 family)